MNAASDETGIDRPEIGWLPWHAPAVERLRIAVADSRLPHALIVHGPAGVGKDLFARTLAATLHCRARTDHFTPCGSCSECALSFPGTHPDLRFVEREEDRKTISVDQVRDLSAALAMTSLRSGYRVAIITPANLMTLSAQNALLKTLEEPAPATLLVLVTSRPSALAATLRSRSQRVEIARPTDAESRAWLASRLPGAPSRGLLELAGGSPFRALEIAPHFEALESQMTAILEALISGQAEVTALAADLMGEGLPVRLDWIEYLLAGIVRARTPGIATQLTLPGAPLLQRAAGAVNITVVFNLVDRVREIRRLLESSASPVLLMEGLLVEFQAAFGRAGGR
jgi:DNA polymerase-3 subunit delta'